jgi:septum formation protein
MSEPVEHPGQKLLRVDAPTLVLASGSAARAAMLRSAGLPFTQIRPEVDEEGLREALQADGAPCEDAATVLAEMKARRGSAMSPPDALVIGADQILEIEGDWLAKPGDRAAAADQLRRLRGRTHRLVSAVVAFRGGARVWHDVRSARLTVRAFSDSWLEAYLDACGEEVLESVGCYRLEGLGAQLMDRVEGDHFTVLGLPLIPLLRFLRDHRVLAA